LRISSGGQRGNFGSTVSGETKHQEGGNCRQTQAHYRASAEEHPHRARQEGCGDAKEALIVRKAHLRFRLGFKVALGNRRAQAATMTIAPGDSEGGSDNRHRGADQWLFVESGTGTAIVQGRRHALRAGSLLLIQRGDVHEIRNTGRRPLRTLNIYVPPAYTKSGDELPRGRK
jgi:mannose-6-phosphate isomerase-like protein (cupin superfamily)